jgi:hypothetical protein
VGPDGFFIIPKLSKPVQTWKLKTHVIPYSKNSQILHAARLEYYEQLSQLCQHQIIKRIRVKKPGTNSTFESLLNFKRGLNLPAKSGKFPKIIS